MKIIGISGKARSGKTTLGNELNRLYGWNHVSLARCLKDKAKAEFGLTEAEVNGHLKETISKFPPMTHRDILIALGKAYRNIDKDFWIRHLPLDSAAVNVISDVRFKNEAEWIQRQGGRLVRLERAVELRGMDIDDMSETDLDDYKFDLLVPAQENVNIFDISRISDRVYLMADLAYAA